MRFWFFAIFFFVLLIPLVLGILIPVYRNHRQASGDVKNYDSAMRKFVYKVPLSPAEIIHSLACSDSADTLSCTLDLERSVISFAEYGSGRDYFFQIQEGDGGSILRLSQVPSMELHSMIPYQLNPFLVQKLHAEIVPFSVYGV